MNGGVYLNKREEDLRGRGAQGHESEVGHGLVPDSHCGHRGFPVSFGDGHLFLLQSNTFIKISNMPFRLNSYSPIPVIRINASVTI